jgi:hypothetical protein
MLFDGLVKPLLVEFFSGGSGAIWRGESTVSNISLKSC